MRAFPAGAIGFFWVMVAVLAIDSGVIRIDTSKLPRNPWSSNQPTVCGTGNCAVGNDFATPTPLPQRPAPRALPRQWKTVPDSTPQYMSLVEEHHLCDDPWYNHKRSHWTDPYCA